MEEKHDLHSIGLISHEVFCAHCGQSGMVQWDALSRHNAAIQALAPTDEPFVERLGKKPPYPIELICRECGEVALTAYPSTSLYDRRQYY